MKLRASAIIIIGLILISFVSAVYFYFQMPAKMASHWNFEGAVDGYLPKFRALFLMPLISLGLFLLFLFIPKIDPLKANIEKFRKYFDGFMVLITVFLFYLYVLSVSWNLGWRFNMGRVMAPALGILFYYCGVLTGHAKRNWFIGIRTPWTLSSDAVWSKTQRLGAKLFKIAGLSALLGAVFPRYLALFVLVPAISAAVFSVAYSYFAYQKESKQGARKQAQG